MRILLTILFLKGFIVFGQTKSTIQSCHSKIDTLTNQLVYVDVDEVPFVSGGLETLAKEVQRRMIYSKDCRASGGVKMIVAFVVGGNGEVSGQRTLKNTCGGNETQQLLDILDDLKWQPGRCNGKAVPTLFVFPMSVKLSR